MKKKPKPLKKSFWFRKLYLNDLEDLVNIIDKKLIRYTISDENHEYDNFDEFLKINKKLKKIKKLYIEGFRNINIPSNYNENKTEIEFNIELNSFHGAIINTEDDEHVKEIQVLVTDVLNRNKMNFISAISSIMGFFYVILAIGLLIGFVMMLLTLMGIESVENQLKDIIMNYNEIPTVYIIVGLLGLYPLLYPNKLRVYLFERSERFKYLKQNKWKIVWEILKYLSPIIALLIGKYLL